MRIDRILVALALACLAGLARADALQEAGDSLRRTHEQLQPQLQASPFGRPLRLDSRESNPRLTGDIHAVVDESFASLSAALGQPGGWCDVLMLQFNTKRCQVAGRPERLVINVGRKHDQPLDQTVQVEFPFRLTAASPEYFAVVLNAPSGPFGTRDFRILLEAVPLAGDRSFLHLSYSYGVGLAARVATRTYLATTGRHKAGFTVVGRGPDGEPVYVGGVRGMIERNTMRYYLAIESYLESLRAPADARVETRLNDWFAEIERYPRQLREMDRQEYLDMKRRELRRQEG